MSFEDLQNKVEQAEQALEARERSAASDLRQLRASWREAWTPGRIVIAGLASGFVFGKSRALQQGTGSSVLKLMLGFTSLLTAKSAETSATAAKETARSAEASVEVARDTVEDVVGIMPVRAVNAADEPHASVRPGHTPEDFRHRGSL